MYRMRFITLGVLFALLSGCSDEEMKPTFPIEGKVTYKGKPAKGAVVSFHPLGDNATAKPQILPTADCEDDGSFRLSTYMQHDGAPEGDYAVTIFWAAPTKAVEEEDEGDEEERGETINLLPHLYSHKDTTTLKYTVKAGPNEPANFDIE